MPSKNTPLSPWALRLLTDRLPHTCPPPASTTLDPATQLALRSPETIITGFDRTNLSYHVVRTRTDDDKDAALVQTLREHEGLAVVYAATRRAVERIATVLERARIRTVAYHAGLDDARGADRPRDEGHAKAHEGEQRLRGRRFRREEQRPEEPGAARNLAEQRGEVHPGAGTLGDRDASKAWERMVAALRDESAPGSVN